MVDAILCNPKLGSLMVRFINHEDKQLYQNPHSLNSTWIGALLTIVLKMIFVAYDLNFILGLESG